MEFGPFDQWLGEMFQGVFIALFSFTKARQCPEAWQISGRVEGNDGEALAIASKLNNPDNS